MYSKYHEPTFHQPGLNPHILNTAGNRIILFRSVTILYILYFYLIDIEVMPSFTIIAIASLYTYSLYRRLTLLTTTTLLFSD
jgi:hypothetical protein